jgi:D-alanyl-D-alanine carboxypeptidase (penicillin-binding protein 5/6)
MRHLLTIMLFFALVTPAFAVPKAVPPKVPTPVPVIASDTIAKQAILIDADTKTVLMEKNSQQRMPTSSMAKTMTAYLVFEALKSGRISPDTAYTVSQKAWSTQGSKMFVPLGQQVKVGDLIQGVIVQSGNDACIVLAEGIAGSEEAFAEMMNKKAEEFGMKNTHFMNASGLPDPNHYSTAYDLAILSYHLIHDFPEYYHYFSEIDYTYNGIKQGNRNPLLYRNIGADGLKTGHTEDGGYGLMGTAIQNGRRLIIVINGLASMQERADEPARLLSWGFTNFQYLNLFKANDEVDKAKVWMGVKENVPIVVKEDLKTIYKLGEKDKLQLTASIKEPIQAPVVKGTQIGVLKIKSGEFPEREVPLYAGEDVAKLGMFQRMVERAKLMVSSGD